jgi:pSer/pThr/pTyr-binding forkhead associated (FHA) protein
MKSTYGFLSAAKSTILTRDLALSTMAYYYLEVIRGQEIGRRHLLKEGAITVGRSSDNMICINSVERTVSSHHAIIYKHGDSISIQDIGSTNGTYKNGTRIADEADALKQNDEVSFGEKGPKVKLIISQVELSTTPQSKPGGSPKSQIRIVSKNDETERSFRTGLERDQNENQDALFSTKKRLKKQPESNFGYQTMELENKILNKRLSADEMNKLMKQGDRVEKIIQQGNLSETQVHFLHTTYDAQKKLKKKSTITLSVVGVVSLILITFFTVRMFQYKALVNDAVSSEKNLDKFDSDIANAKKRGASEATLEELVAKFEDERDRFNNLKSNLRDKDVKLFYEDTIEYYIAEIMGRLGETEYHIPKEMTVRVKFHIGVYTGSLRPVIARYLERKKIYFPMILKIFSAKKVPPELAYVSMLESGFNPNALSHAGARGLWQFMPKTGRSFKLRVDDMVDERTDPEKATYAAAEYFLDLIGIFGGQSSVMLAMAAYNAGEGRVMGALRKIEDPVKNRDFWYIYNMGYLAEETNEYIPRVLAMMIIDQHAEKYGFKAQLPLDQYNQAELTKETDFVPVPVHKSE